MNTKRRIAGLTPRGRGHPAQSTKHLWLTFAALLASVVLTGCSYNNGAPANYKFDEERPAARPGGASDSHEAYADCMINEYDTRNHGYRSSENIQLWAIQRCRFLEPPPLGLTTATQVQNCIYEYGPWLADRFNVQGFPKGWTGSRTVTALETICAPSPSSDQG